MFTKGKQDITTKARKTSSKRKYEIKAGENRLYDFGRTGRPVGKLSGDTAYKDVCAETAFLKYPYPAIAHTIAALEYMREMGIVYIDVLETTSGIHYRTTVQKYFDEGEFFNGGAKWGDQLKLALPNFQQSRNPEYTEPTETGTPEYTEDGTTETKPLVYVSHAPVGVRYEKGIKQLSLFGGG